MSRSFGRRPCVRRCIIAYGNPPHPLSPVLCSPKPSTESAELLRRELASQPRHRRGFGVRNPRPSTPSAPLLPETSGREASPRKGLTDRANLVIWRELEACRNHFQQRLFLQGSSALQSDIFALAVSSRGLLYRMQEKEATIGLSWAPKLLIPSSEKKGNSVDSLSLPETSIWKADSELVDGLYVPPREPKKLNKLLKKNMKDTTGKSWFDMPAPIITPELKTDLEILKLRNFIDPKRHFKKGDRSKAPPKYFQVGTVVEPASEFFSSRLTKKERKATLADELLSDSTFQAYRKRKVQEVNESRRPGGVSKWKIKGRTTWKRAKDRRN